MNQTQSVVLSDCKVICAAGDTSTLLQGLHKAPEEVLTIDSGFLRDGPGYFGKIELPENLLHPNLARISGILQYLTDQMVATIDRLKTSYRSDRIAVIIGTTTTGIREVESRESVSKVDYHNHQEISAAADDLANYCGINGPNIVISTACTSGAKALALGRTLLRAGWCDAVMVGASESLNRLTCQGFESLESYSTDCCKPFQPNRDGINIGEGGALFTMEKGFEGIALAGFSESSDAWHESAPDPKGIGAANAIRSAMLDANFDIKDIDYINLHGTGTRLNDAMEADVVHRIFGATTPASSTKTVTGHLLGAAGAVEAAILWLLLNRPTEVPLPPQHGVENVDQSLPRINLVNRADNPARKINGALSTSFAFGGHNTALILSRTTRVC